jgi:lysine 2,3-aminomutase
VDTGAEGRSLSARSLRRVADLVVAGLATPEAAAALEQVSARYAVSLTPDMAALISRDNPADPIALQFLPDPRELAIRPEELADPIGDSVHAPVEGIVHRYPDRVLLKLLHTCPVYCRFCFRREVVGPGGPQVLAPQALDTALGYISAHPEIWEVILTGGDPLALAPRRLAEILRSLAEIPHVKILRIHTRVPVVSPALIDAALVEALRAFRGPVWVALHANHPREFTPAAGAAIARLVDAGIVMVSQSVLLKGVNDDVATLSGLMRLFVEHRIKPYYLHHPDLAPGTSHFRVSLARGRELVRALHGALSGLCQPAYVLDIPGGFGKARAETPQIVADPATDGDWAIEDFRGRRHAYRDSTDAPAEAAPPPEPIKPS